MGILKRVWDYSGWIIGGYTIYNRLMAMQEAKTSFYSGLTKEQQDQWDHVFGKPTVPPIITPTISLARISPTPTTQVPTLEQIKAGT